MKRHFVTVAAVVGLLAAHRSLAVNPPKPASQTSGWIDLSREPSRTTLFEQMRVSKLTTDPEMQKFPFPMSFGFPKDISWDSEAHKPRGDVVYGIDVSHYSSPDLSVSLLHDQGISFVYAKATQGVQFSDGLFKRFWAALDGLRPRDKVYRGAYHFLSAGIDGKKQADRFVDFVNLQGGFKPDDMPPCVDLEWDRTQSNPDQWKGYTAREIVDEVSSWLNEVEKRTGRKPIIYTAQSWWGGVVPQNAESKAQFERLSSYKIWVADYSKSGRYTENPGAPLNGAWTVWQFTSNSFLEHGYPEEGRVDASVYKGKINDLLSELDVKQVNLLSTVRR